MNANREKGNAGEDAALLHYQRRGCTLLARNYRAFRCEVDLILRQGETVVFVEVKARSGSRYGTPAEAVTAAKQANLRKAAQMYLAEHGLLESPARFDVAEVDLNTNAVHLICNAF